jgi:hypothetical protein
VLLPLVGLENLSRVILGLETLEQALHLEPIKPPEVTEDFWSVGLHFHIGLDCSCWILVELFECLKIVSIISYINCNPTIYIITIQIQRLR